MVIQQYWARVLVDNTMGLFQSCLAKNNELRVVPVVKEEIGSYEKVIRALVTEDMTEKRSGVAFDLTFFSEKTPKMPSPKMLKKADFESERVGTKIYSIIILKLIKIVMITLGDLFFPKFVKLES